MQDEQTEYLNAVSNDKVCILKAMEVKTPPLVNDMSTKTTPLANLTSASKTVLFEMLKLLKEIKNNNAQNNQKRKNFSINSSQSKQNNNNNKENENIDCKKKKYGDTNANGKYTRYNILKYCNLHGACGYQSNECKKRNDNHKANATFQNMMGGCKDFCQV